MEGSLGEKIGEGVFADVHAWGDGQVVKLSKPGLPPWVLQHEAQMTRAVFGAGGSAPEVLREVTLDGRFGFVLPRFDGPTLRQALRTGATTPKQAGAILATLCLAVHKTPPPAGALSLRQAMDARLRFAGNVLPERIIAGVFARIEHVGANDVLCHSDLHPGNQNNLNIQGWTFAWKNNDSGGHANNGSFTFSNNAIWASSKPGRSSFQIDAVVAA